MRFPIPEKLLNKKLPQDPEAMSENELIAGIARCDDVLTRRRRIFVEVASRALIIVTAVALSAAWLGAGMVGLPLLATGFGAGGSTVFGIGLACKVVMTRAQREKWQYEGALAPKVEARIAAEHERALEAAEAERLRKLSAKERFEEAVRNGLPLESDLKLTRRRLRVKLPDNRTGLARVIGGLFDPIP